MDSHSFSLNGDDETVRDAALHVGISALNQDFKEREVRARAEKLKISYINLLESPINPDTLSFISRELSEKSNAIPFFHMGKKIHLAFCDPENDALKSVFSLLQKKFEVWPFLCSSESLSFAQQNYEKRFYHDVVRVFADVDDERDFSLHSVLEEAAHLPEKIQHEKSDIALNALHEIVLKLGVSDIHFHPQQNDTLVRARLDGVLREIFRLPPKTATNIVRQIKHDSELKYNITHLPQDGKYSFSARDRDIDVRVSTFPSNTGESIVLRFLDSKKGIVPLERLGFDLRTKRSFEKNIAASGGMILVTGPTGSGKTTTLYSALDKINTPEKKIATLEDPVEFHLDGVVQSNIDEAKGFTFDRALRSMLRQDPDVLLIGEIRDRITAETAVQAALTGHLVFSTLHTNSAADAIPRLVNMGIEPFLLAPALRTIVAQRLVRVLCSDCKKKREPTLKERALFSDILDRFSKEDETLKMPDFVFETVGCNKCGQSGFRGETAVVEFLEINNDLTEMLLKSRSSLDIARLAKKMGMRTMWEMGVLKVMSGETTMKELVRRVQKGE